MEVEAKEVAAEVGMEAEEVMVEEAAAARVAVPSSTDATLEHFRHPRATLARQPCSLGHPERLREGWLYRRSWHICRQGWPVCGGSWVRHGRSLGFMTLRSKYLWLIVR